MDAGMIMCEIWVNSYIIRYLNSVSVYSTFALILLLKLLKEDQCYGTPIKVMNVI